MRHVSHPAPQCVVAVVVQREGFAGDQAGQARDARARGMQARDMELGTHRAQRVDVLFVGRVVDEGAEKHAMACQQVFQQVVRPHLVALVRRVRQPVDQIKQVGHAGYPRFRTTKGPSQLARPIGMRRHASIIRRNLALAGLFCGTASRL